MSDRKRLLKTIELQIKAEEARRADLKRDGALDALYLIAHYLMLQDNRKNSQSGQMADPGIPNSQHLSLTYRWNLKDIKHFINGHLTDLENNPTNSYYNYYGGFQTGMSFCLGLFKPI